MIKHPKLLKNFGISKGITYFDMWFFEEKNFRKISLQGEIMLLAMFPKFFRFDHLKFFNLWKFIFNGILREILKMILKNSNKEKPHLSKRVESWKVRDLISCLTRIVSIFL